MTSPAQAIIEAAKQKVAAQQEQNAVAATPSAADPVAAPASVTPPEQAPQPGVTASQTFASSVGNSTQLQSTSTIPQATKLPGEDPVAEVVVQKGPATREFQHVYAGAGVNLPNGKRLTFGGAPGGNGRYVTARADEISYLAELAETQGSQVTEIFRDSEGREVARGAGSSLERDFRLAAKDAAANTVADVDPNVNTARNNLPNVIKMNG